MLQALEEELHLLAKLQVERAERPVEKQHLRLADERARKRDALLLAARELARLALAEAAELDELEHLLDPAPDLLLVDLLAAEAERDVLEDRQVREQRVALEDGVDVAAIGREAGDVAPRELDDAARRLLEAADHPQRRRLAAARRAEHREEAAALDLHRERVDGDDLVELLRDVLQTDVRRRRRRRVVGARRRGDTHAVSFATTALSSRAPQA